MTHPRSRGKLSKAVGVVIKRMRRENGLTQAVLGERIGVGDESVRKVEIYGCLNLEAVTRYACAMGMSASSIVAMAESELRETG